MNIDALPSHLITVPGSRLHCVERPGSGTPILLLHSLSGNTRLFAGLLAADIAPGRRLLLLDMRGRGRTPVGRSDMSLGDACADIEALLAHFGVERAILAGHSYGGLTALHFSAHHAERVERLLLFDAAARMHPAASTLATLTATRLDQVYPSRALYLESVRRAPFVDAYHPEMEAFFNEDVMDLALGACISRARFLTVAAAMHHISSRRIAAWQHDAQAIQAPTLLVHADRPYLMGVPMMTDWDAADTVGRIRDAQGVLARGNHFSMLFGDGAEDIRQAMERFLA